MTVIAIVTLLIFLILIYQMVKKLDEVMLEKFNYRFFTTKSLCIYILIYPGLFLGYSLFHKALINHSDILDGILIMLFAISLFVYILVNNIKNTDFVWGVVVTLFQAFVYLPLSFLGIFVLIGMFATYTPARAVYIVK